MRNLPSFFSLRAFEAAARQGSFALAGEELHISPSAVSHQVRSLEEYFGKSLFDRRSGHGVEVNVDGIKLLSRLTPALDEIEAACFALKPLQKKAVLALRCAPSFATKWLGPRLPAFMKLNPDIVLHMTASADPVDFARDSGIDMAVTYAAPNTQTGVVSEPLGEEYVTALIAPALNTELNFDGPSLPQSLSLIESTRSPLGWQNWLSSNNLASPPADVYMPSFDRAAMAIAAAAQGVGAALESTRLAAEELSKGEVVELGDGRFKGTQRVMHFLCYRSGSERVRKIEAFRAWLLANCELDTGA